MVKMYYDNDANLELLNGKQLLLSAMVLKAMHMH